MDIGHDEAGAELYAWAPKMPGLWRVCTLDAYHDGGPSHGMVMPRRQLESAPAYVSGRVSHRHKAISLVVTLRRSFADVYRHVAEAKTMLADAFPGYEVYEFD